MSYITVNQEDFLMPFFLVDLTWLSKKEKDYLDWKLILNILKQKHFTEEGKELIALIANRMNNNRL